jgi:hypothetical protein
MKSVPRRQVVHVSGISSPRRGSSTATAGTRPAGTGPRMSRLFARVPSVQPDHCIPSIVSMKSVLRRQVVHVSGISLPRRGSSNATAGTKPASTRLRMFCHFARVPSVQPDHCIPSIVSMKSVPRRQVVHVSGISLLRRVSSNATAGTRPAGTGLRMFCHFARVPSVQSNPCVPIMVSMKSVPRRQVVHASGISLPRHRSSNTPACTGSACTGPRMSHLFAHVSSVQSNHCVPIMVSMKSLPRRQAVHVSGVSLPRHRSSNATAGTKPAGTGLRMSRLFAHVPSVQSNHCVPIMVSMKSLPRRQAVHVSGVSLPRHGSSNTPACTGSACTGPRVFGLFAHVLSVQSTIESITYQ